MSIRWIRNVLIDGEEKTLEIQLGYHRIGDRCYIRIGQGIEEYFVVPVNDRDTVVFVGIEELQKRLMNNVVTYPDGRMYDWK